MRRTTGWRTLGLAAINTLPDEGRDAQATPLGEKFSPPDPSPEKSDNLSDLGRAIDHRRLAAEVTRSLIGQYHAAVRLHAEASRLHDEAEARLDCGDADKRLWDRKPEARIAFARSRQWTKWYDLARSAESAAEDQLIRALRAWDESIDSSQDLKINLPGWPARGAVVDGRLYLAVSPDPDDPDQPPRLLILDPGQAMVDVAAAVTLGGTDRVDPSPRPGRRARRLRRRRRLRLRIRAAIGRIKTAGRCAICGRPGPGDLTFHHLPGLSRRFTIGKASRWSIGAVRAEIAKTCLVCGNPCHRDLHAGRLDGSGLVPLPVPDASLFSLPATDQG
jgi:hypothetical protein